jgi:hypothetical protein
MQFDYLREAFTLRDIPYDEKLNIETLHEPPPTPFKIKVNHANSNRWLSSVSASYEEVTVAYQQAQQISDSKPHIKKAVYVMLLRDKCGYNFTNLQESTNSTWYDIKNIFEHHDRRMETPEYKTLYYQVVAKLNELQLTA